MKSTFHVEFAAEDVPFRKQSNFAYQKEYRVCLQTPTAGNDAVTFEIGDMSAFAIKVTFSGYQCFAQGDA